MFNSIKELQEFIIWATEHKVKRVKVKDIEIEISDLALIQEYTGSSTSQVQNQKLAVTEPLQNAENAKVEEEDLYWSVTN